MRTFSYEAMNGVGQKVNGTVNAKDSDAAIAKVRAKKMFPTKIKEKRTEKNVTIFDHVSTKNKSGRAKLIVKIGIGIGILLLGILIGLCIKG